MPSPELQDAMHFSALVLFLVCASGAWKMRGVIQRKPVVGYLLGLFFVILGMWFDLRSADFKGASTIFNAGIIGLGVSMISASLGVVRRIESLGQPMEPASAEDPLVVSLSIKMAAAKACVVDLETRPMARRHRDLHLKRAREHLIQLLLIRREVTVNRQEC